MPIRADQRIGTELAGYRLTALLGRGGMSAVYLAEDRRLGRKVALKLLARELSEDERFRRRFLRESRLAASIDHSNIVPIYEAGEADGALYIAMRHVDGADLRELLAREGPLEPKRALALLTQVADALDAAHEHGLVHRDVKPSNVLLARESGREHCYLSDFGLTKGSASMGDLTDAGHLMGTIDYVAPEQLEGGPLDGRADVYALGCVLFECLTGEVPFRRDSDLAVLWAHVQDPPPSAQERRPALSAAIDAVIAKAMAKDPEERYASCAELVAAARVALAGEVDPVAVSVRRKRRRRTAAFLTLIGATATAVAVGVVAVVLHLIGGEATGASFEPGIAIVHAQTGKKLASIPTSVVREPNQVIYGEGHFWVQNLDPMSLVEIDAKTGRILKQIGLPFEEIGTYTVDGDTLWVSGPELVKFDISLGREVDRFDFGDWLPGVVVADGSLWVVMEGTVLRLDPATGKVQHRFDVLPDSGSLAYADGSVWVGGQRGVSRIDPDTNAVTKTALQLPVDCCPTRAGGGFGWTADQTKGVVYKIDRSGQVVATYGTGPGATIASYSGGPLWVRNSDAGTVVGIDPVTGARRTFRFEHPVQGAAAGAGVLVVALGPGRTYEDRIVALEGKVAKLFYGPLDALENPDPATGPDSWVEFATCAKLLNYPDAAAPAGWKLRPEIATSLPEISPGGRTYTFRIRPGYRFSPPANEEVTAQTFRYSIERALSPEFAGPAPEFVSDIEGEAAFRAGKAEHISGLRAEGDILTITLTEPSRNFLQRLALPFFCPVPTDSPPVKGGAGAFVGYPQRTPQAVPSAGPYYIADHLVTEYAILKRNPNYTGPRPHALDAIALREGIDPGQAVRQVQNGSWDGIVGIEDPLLDVGAALDQRWGPGSGAASQGDQRFVAAPLPETTFLLFNAGRGLFADRDVRRAAALALNRRALADVWKGAPSDQILPVVMPGFEDRELYSLDRPDLREARVLMRGRKSTAVMGITASCTPCLQEAQVVRADLAKIGIRVRIEKFDDPGAVARNRQAKVDILAGQWRLDYADSAEFLRSMLLDTGLAHWLPAGVEADVRKVTSLEGAARQRAAVELADRLAVKEVPVAALGTDSVTGFFSPHLACRVFPPFGYGIDLAALCLNENK